MKKLFKIFLLTLVISSMTASLSLAYASPFSIKTGKDGKEYTQFVSCPDDKSEVSMLQGGDMIGELPPIIIYINGERAKGAFTYSNYDNARLGIWDLEWIFIPTDANYEPVSGTIKLNVRPRDEEPIEAPTIPSLTASAVQLDTRTAYDINLADKITGSEYTWTSSDTEVVEVNSTNGKLKAIKEGKANVICEITLPNASTQTLVSEVTVGYDANAPLLTETDLDLEIGDVFDINLENKVAKSKYRWVSSDKTIAKVNSSNGKVTAMGAGTAYVICTITTPGNQVIVLRCDISVTEPVPVTE